MVNLEARTVLVTGADGFIGSHLVERLAQLGCEVLALAQYNSMGTAGWLDALDTGSRAAVTVEWGDIRDAACVSGLVREASLVFHLAALIAIPYSYRAPQSYVDTNVQGTLNLLEASRAWQTEKVIVTSTSEVYGTPESVPITTSHALRAQSPYAATKIAADQLAQAYAASFDMNVSILRPFNTFGPRQSMRAVIPTILNQMLAGLPEIRLGDLEPKRDFTFVSDTVEGFIHMAQSETQPGQVIQLGTGVTVSVGDLVTECREITGCSAPVVCDAPRIRPEASEVQILMADPTEAFDTIGWAPVVPLREGLRLTSEWIGGQTNRADADRYHQ
jgi:NAD dependent epimerase/dehydratase